MIVSISCGVDAHHPVGPFYTIGRFVRARCTGKNRLEGICLTRGECDLGEGIQAGPCGHASSFAKKHAICCTCKLPLIFGSNVY